MRKSLIVLSLLSAALLPCSAQRPVPAAWKTKVAETMPLLGHRNWILIVDSAYPLQVSPGVETIETNADQLEVVQSVLHAIARSIHVRPVITMDAELRYVPEDDAPGVTSYRNHIGDLLHDYTVDTQPHEQIIANVAKAGEQFHVLVLKTNMTVPYTSVFIRLDCKYWSADAEKRLRAAMP
jgi:hypothetical protein